MRARLIREGFWTNEELSEVSINARLLFIGLWCLADREGLFKWKPKSIKASLFPYDNIKISHHLDELQKKNFIIKYEVDKESYGAILNFKKHQSIHKHERASILPSVNVSTCMDARGHVDHASLVEVEVEVEVEVKKGESEGKTKDTKLVKEKLGSHFIAYKEEIEDLLAQDGEEVFRERVRSINDYCSSHGRAYKDYAAAYRQWRARDRKSYSPKNEIKNPLSAKNQLAQDALQNFLKKPETIILSDSSDRPPFGIPFAEDEIPW